MDDCRWSIIIYFWNLTIPVRIYTPFLHRADSLILKYYIVQLSALFFFLMILLAGMIPILAVSVPKLVVS